MAENNEENKKEEAGKADPIQAEGKKSKLFIFIIIGVAVLGAVGAGGFIVFKTLSGKKDHAADAAPAADSSSDKKDGDAKDASHDDKKEGDKAADAPKDGASDQKKDGEAKDAPHDDKKDEKKDEQKNSQGHDDKKDGDAKDASHDDKKDGDKSADAPKDGATPDQKKDDSDFGDVFSIEKMDLNLGNPIENRYLRLGVAIEYRGGKNQLEELQKRQAQLKDIIITTASKKSRLELLSETGKEKLRRELLNRINEVTDRPIDNVYFSDFLVE